MKKFFILLILILFPFITYAQHTQDNKLKNINKPTSTMFSDVKVGDFIVFKVGSIDTLGHEERAEIINNRINNIINQSKIIPSPTVEYWGNKNIIKVNNEVILTVTEQDAIDNLKTLSDITKEWVSKLEEAFKLLKKQEREPIIIDGTIIFYIGPTDYLTAIERASIVNRRIQSFLNNPEKIKPAYLKYENNKYLIYIDNIVLLTVIDEDTQFTALTSKELAKKWVKLINNALDRAKREREPFYNIYIIFNILLCSSILFILHKILNKLKDKLLSNICFSEKFQNFKTYYKLVIHLFYLIIFLSVFVYIVAYLLDLIPYTRPYLNEFLHELPQIISQLYNISYQNLLIILLIVIFTIPILKIANLFINNTFNFIQKQAEVEKTDRFIQRSNTAKLIIKSILNVTIIFTSFLLILYQLNINVIPILASAGILGLAISFGAQNLVKDIINGFFIVFEDQYGVGDVITINDITGTVEKMNLRITQLRGLDGSLTTIPNSNINVVINLSKEWSRAVLDVPVALSEDIERVIKIIMNVANNLRNEWSEKIIEDPIMLGLERVENSQMIIRLMIKTVPLEQWEVVRELRKRVKIEFDKNNIQMPYPQTIVWLNQPKPNLLQK